MLPFDNLEGVQSIAYTDCHESEKTVSTSVRQSLCLILVAPMTMRISFARRPASSESPW